MDFLTIVYLVYIFVALYFVFLFLLIYIPNRKDFYKYPKPKKEYSLSMVVPCYNGEDSVGKTLQSLIDSDYSGLKKIVVVDDQSTDNSYKIMKEFEKKYPDKILVVQTPKNTGKASGAKNYGAKFVDTDLIGFTDDDSFPAKDAIRKMIGFFDNPKVGATTSVVLVKNRNKFMEKLQSIEYKVIAFTRKLLGFVDGIYVTPGPLAIYRKKVFDEVNGFDEQNMTEDIEIVWHLIYQGYKVEMSTKSFVHSVAPSKYKPWFKQRIRWNVGGLQTIMKYKKSFMKKGMLGYFVLPLFVGSWLLQISGISFLIYRTFRRIALNLLMTGYSVKTNTAVVAMNDLNLVPSVLLFFGIVLLAINVFLIFVALYHTREEDFRNPRIFSVVVYMFIYVLSYPLILISSMYKFLTRSYSW